MDSSFAFDTLALPANGSRFGYDAIESKGRRKAATGIVRSEDAELQPIQRRKLVQSTRDINRNYAVAAWAIRKHLDYVSKFNIQFKTGDKSLDFRLENLMSTWSRAENCDIAGRHHLRRFVRLLEARRTIDGDVLLLRLANGQLQAIEGDRVRTPVGGMPGEMKLPLSQMRHGVVTDQFGRPTGYSVCKRTTGSDYYPGGGGFVFERIVSARHSHLHAYFDRFDQTRGISPLASALNTLRDTYEGMEYALAKMKVAQLFGLKITRESDDAIGEVSEQDDDESQYKVDFGKGPIFLDMDPGDDASFLENKTPSTEFQEFIQTSISVSLKSLDIPFSFFDESYTNYSGARQALLQYEESARDKREDVRAMLDWITAWRIRLWMQDGELQGVDPLQLRWEWIPTGLPWIDPLKEMNADVQGIEAGLTSRTRALRQRGEDFFEVADELAAEKKYLEDLGLESRVTPVSVTINEGGNNAGPQG